MEATAIRVAACQVCHPGDTGTDDYGVWVFPVFRKPRYAGQPGVWNCILTPGRLGSTSRARGLS